MNNNSEAVDQYRLAVKMGERYYDQAVKEGENPYLPALDDMVRDIQKLNTRYLGYMDIPIELIAGTKTNGRQDAFAGNFMPLMDRYTEFGMKWINLCNSHFSEGIREPIQCFEYMGKFYVQEGNKRVSVLKSLGAVKIPGTVTRIYPKDDGSEEVRLYHEFLDFWELSRLYSIQFRKPGCYAKLQASLGFEPDHKWTEDERAAFSSRLFTFKSVFEDKKRYDFVDADASTGLLCWLQVYPYESLKKMSVKELETSLGLVWPEIILMTGADSEAISTGPRSVEKSFISKLFSSGMSRVNVAFIHAATTSGSNWVKGHESGADHLEETLGNRVNIETYYADPDNAEGVMENAIRGGAQVLIVTAPTLLSATRKVATLHPKTIVLVCALSMPMAGVSAYYSRMYEAKFVAGAIAGAMSDDDTIGFVAKYPIFGVPSEINAFALGARMTNPDVKIRLKWSGVEQNPSEKLLSEGVRVISGHDVSTEDELKADTGFGTFQIDEGGKILPLSAPCWNWGTFYERVIMYILNGEWEEVSRHNGSEVNYWWGLDSGIIDIALADRLPAGVVQLAKILKKNIISDGIDIFKTKLTDNHGNVINDGSRSLDLNEVMHMDWLLDNVDGEIPGFDELLPMARNLTRILGVYRDEIPPEKEEFLL
ncbi:MAG: BMP family ABC transporter substrate-binding protein [Lachnospiraceae bacterium]|nr:BMP family ABC transporter substrate-binding protein [Lachnospiraceae bacterium]